MSEKQQQIPLSEFQTWLRPRQSLERLPPEWTEQQKVAALKLRLSQGLVRSAARRGSTWGFIGNRSLELARIDQLLWCEPYGSIDENFWATGDRVFDDGHPLDGARVYFADDPPNKYAAKSGGTLIDVRLCPEDLNDQFGDFIPAPPSSKRGGRPPAHWWDDLWIEISRKLYVGDLKPETQVMIEKAMHDWLSAKSIDAGETTIRERARKLFDALHREDEN